MKKSTILALGLLSVLAVGIAIGTRQAGLQAKNPSGWPVRPAGEHQVIGDLAAGGERSPNGKFIAFATVGQGIHKVVIADATTGQVLSNLPINRGWIGLSWSPDSAELFVAGGTANFVHRVKVDAAGKAELASSVAIKGIETNKGWLAGLVVMGDSAILASSASDRLIRVNMATGEITKELKFDDGAAPYQVRLGSGNRLFVSLQGAQQVAEVDAESLTLSRTFMTGRHPNDVLLAGDRLFVACGNDDIVDVFDLANGAREERIVTRPWPNAPAGSTPHALAITRDARTLFVANSDNNAVAVIDVAKRGQSEVEGFIPSGAYPTGLAVTEDGKHLLIAAGKGVGTGPNAKTDKIDPVAPMGYPYVVTLLNGLLSKVKLGDDAELAAMTRTVRSLSPYRDEYVAKPKAAPAPGSNPIPSRLGDPSPIQHILYIIKENRTYDQLFGDLTKNGKQYGNGDPKLTLFGEDVASNHRELAREFVLLDNLYCAGEVSVDGHHWTNGAYVPDFMQRTWPQQYSGKGTPRLSAGLSDTPNGRIWDQCRRAGLSYRTYYYHTRDRMSQEWTRARSAGVRDHESVDIFIREFKEMEQKGSMPRFMVMALSEDHTSGTRPGSPTPKAAVASNDIGLGKIVETISKSSLWGKFAIFVIEDDAQNGPDSVDAHRTVGLVISPYSRSAGLDSTHYTTNSMLRTMELILGLNPMSQHDAAATPMYKSFRNKPDLRPYVAKTPKQDIMAINPPRQQSALLAAIDFSIPDQLTLAQEIELNKDIWYSIRPNDPYPGADRRYGYTSADED